MLCEHCNQNDASCHFVIHGGGRTASVHLCEACLTEIGRQFWVYFAGGPLPPYLGWQPGATATRGAPANQADRPERELTEYFQWCRKITELRGRLKRAVEIEDYESAALIRDEIKALKNKNEATTI